MKHIGLNLVALLLGASAQEANAGFRHPLEQTGQAAVEVQSTPVQRSTSPAAAPVRVPAQASQRPQTNPSTAAKAAPSAPSDRRNTPNLPWPKASPSLPRTSGLVVDSLDLPALRSFNPAPPLPALKLQGKDRAALHAFAKKARALPLPSRDYETNVRARPILEKFRFAFSPQPHRNIRTPLHLKLETTGRILRPQKLHLFENTVKRIDALFAGMEGRPAPALHALWELSHAHNNHQRLQARDALFAGIIARRIGWETVSANLYLRAAAREITREPRYASILWREMERLEQSGNLDRIVASVPPEQARGLDGNKANFAMARRHWSQNPTLARAFADGVQDLALRDHLTLLGALREIRTQTNPSAPDLSALRALAEMGHSSVRANARHTLARSLLRRGETGEALAHYSALVKNGQNRLEATAEHAYAEYLTGNYDASLGKAIGAESVYFRFGFSPDVHLVEILGRKAKCDFGGAEAAIRRFFERYQPELSELAALSERKLSNPIEFYPELISYYGQREPHRYQRYLLRMPVVMENQKLLAGAEREFAEMAAFGLKHKFRERPPGWEKMLASMRKDWEPDAQKLKAESASAALTEARYLTQRLRHVFGQIDLIGLDLGVAAAKDLNRQSAINYHVRRPAEAEVPNGRFLWPFEQEIWEDELEFLKMKNPSRCAAVAAKN